MQTDEITFEIKNEKTKDIRVYCFVCTGNTCRSPMAAAVLNHYGASRGVLAFSRGICAEVGSPLSENAAKALSAAGILSEGKNEYARHRAVQFSARDFECCEGVFAISPSHAQALISAFPEYAAKVRVLSDIPDPYGGDENEYKKCLADITAAIKEVFPYLFNEKL